MMVKYHILAFFTLLGSVSLAFDRHEIYTAKLYPFVCLGTSLGTVLQVPELLYVFDRQVEKLMKTKYFEQY